MACNWKHPVFRDIYDAADGCSQVSGLPISQPIPMNFAHILPKGKYPSMMYHPYNTILVTTHEHTLLDHGTAEQRQRYKEVMAAEGIAVDWDVFYSRIDELKQNFQQCQNQR